MVTLREIKTPDGIRPVWMDANQNYWDYDTYSKQVAEELAKTLKACSLCYNCHDCCRCVACDNCWHCIDCQHCSGCYKCVSCVGCLRCADYCGWCENCTECLHVVQGNSLVRVCPPTNNKEAFMVPNLRGRMVPRVLEVCYE